MNLDFAADAYPYISIKKAEHERRSFKGHAASTGENEFHGNEIYVWITLREVVIFSRESGKKFI